MRYTIRVRFTVWRLMGAILCFGIGIGIVRFILDAEPESPKYQPVAQEELKAIMKSGEHARRSSGSGSPTNSVGPARNPHPGE